jgi:hypothetical protein
MIDNSNIYYIEQSFALLANAGMKPSVDFENVMRKRHFRRIGLKRMVMKPRKLYKLVLAHNWLNDNIIPRLMPRNKVVILQYPGQRDTERRFIAAKNKGNKVVLLVHDIDELREVTNEARGGNKFSYILGDADAVICHTQRMADWLKKTYNQQNTIILGVFDYIIPEPSTCYTGKNGATRIVFAGNLAKSEFLQHIDFPADIQLVLYGVGLPDTVKRKPFVQYMGCCLPNELPEKTVNCEFGLVWDGCSADTCVGGYGNYLRYNAPYKLSSSLAAGLPVIIWKEMGIAPFIEQNGLGIAVNSLNEIPARLAQLTDAEYAEMRNRVADVAKKIRTGYFYNEAITKACELVLR